MILHSIDAEDKVNSTYLENGGYIQEMSSYWYGEDESWRQQFTPAALAHLENSGELKCIPIDMVLFSAVLNPNCSPDACTTYADTLHYLENSTEIPFLSWSRKEDYLKEMLAVDMDSFICWESNKADFACDSFRALLRLCKEYCLSDIEMNMEFDSSQFLFRNTVDSFAGENYLYYTYRPLTQNWNVNEGCVRGYPLGSESDAYVRFDETISVTSDCSNVELAWQFIKYMLSEEVQSYHYEEESSAPFCSLIRWDVLENAMDFLTHPSEHQGYWYTFDSDFNVLYGYSENEAQTFLDYYTTIHHTLYPDMEIINIVVEESAGYFSEQRSMDDVIQTINERVQIILDERAN